MNHHNEDPARASMNKMYKRWRHIYDASRMFYLFGRDEMIESLDLKPKENLCEVGCGTARNLIKMAQRYPGANICGIDVSDEMLKTARHKVESSGFAHKVHLAQASASTFVPAVCFPHLTGPLDKIVFSYVLSISPDWKAYIHRALDVLAPGGALYVTDFGSEKSHAFLIRLFMKKKLGMFHVYCTSGLLDYLRTLEENGAGRITACEAIRAGRAYNIVFKKS